MAVAAARQPAPYQRPPLVETLSAGPRLPAWSTAWIVKEVTPASTVIDCFDPAGAVAGMVWLKKLTLWPAAWPSYQSPPGAVKVSFEPESLASRIAPGGLESTP